MSQDIGGKVIRLGDMKDERRIIQIGSQGFEILKKDHESIQAIHQSLKKDLDCPFTATISASSITIKLDDTTVILPRLPYPLGLRRIDPNLEPDCKHKHSFAFAIDIDGVLIDKVKGKVPLPGAKEVLLLLQKCNIPFIILTNRLGYSEESLSKKISDRLTLSPPLKASQIVQSHTPFKDLVVLQRDAHTLVVGKNMGDDLKEIAQSYGLNPVRPSDEWLKDVIARLQQEPAPLETEVPQMQIKLITLWTPPTNEEEPQTIQLIIHLLLSHKGILGTVSPLNGNTSLPNNGYQQDSQPQLWLSNWNALCLFYNKLKKAWFEKTGRDFIGNFYWIAKPSPFTFGFAERVLHSWHRGLNGVKAKNIRTAYMIGDTPHADIRGANEFESTSGVEWKSILVQTGVYKPEKGKPTYEPHKEVKGIMEAVEWCLEKEGCSCNSLSIL